MADDDTLLNPEQLCVGLYVELDLGWMEHPFAFNRFKIKSPEQIDTLRRLGLAQIRYNPAKSDCAPLPARSEGEPAPPPPPPPDPAELRAQAEKRARIARVGRIREEISKVEQTFLRAADALKQINRNIRSRPQEVFEQADQVATQLVEVALAEGDIKIHAMSQSLGDDVYFHSLNVAVLSMMIGAAIKLRKEELHQIGLGALLHDVGQLEIPDLVLAKRDNLDKAEQAIYENHVKLGVRIAGKLGLSEAALQVIAQHHERMDGSGYPAGRAGAEISIPARIVAIANAYDNLCNPQDLTRALTPYEALSLLFAKQRKRFDDSLLRTFIRCLGVYPPGTLVRLSDERIGLVISVNARQAMRPQVMVYDPDIPSEAALILDLDAEPVLAVREGLRPAAVPGEILKYLNPRQRVTYNMDRSRSPAR